MKYDFCIEFTDSVDSDNVVEFYKKIRELDDSCPNFIYYRTAAWNPGKIPYREFQQLALDFNVNGRYSFEKYDYNFQGEEVMPQHNVFTYFGREFKDNSQELNDTLWVLSNFSHKELHILYNKIKSIISSYILK